MRKKIVAGLLLLPVLAVCAHPEGHFDPRKGGTFTNSQLDTQLWLEEVDGKQALDWVKSANQATDERLTQDPLYSSLYQNALDALNSKDKLLSIDQMGDWIYNFKKNSEHPRGIYRRSLAEDFNHGAPKWQTVLDMDKLSQKENQKWVFQGMQCLEPAFEKCLVSLSPGGGDAHEVREFNSNTLKFVSNGFKLPTAKSSVSWIDEDHLFVGTDFGAGSMTDSGYPRIQKIWKRGTSITEAKTVLEAEQKSVAVSATRYHSEEGAVDLLVEAIDFWNNRYFQLLGEKAVPLNLPQSAVVHNAYQGQLVVSLQQDWQVNQQKYLQGSVVLVDMPFLRGEKGNIKVLIEPNPKAIVEDITVTQKAILAVMMQDVKSQVVHYQSQKGKWESKLIDLPKQGKIEIETTDENSGAFFVRYEDFLTPPTLYSIDSDLNVSVAMQQSATFDASEMKVEQFFTSSNDGTQVPYFVIMNKKTKFDGSNPTHMFSYGGFRASMKPSYSGSYEDLNGAYGKMWLERGGVYVVANIRGGGEYGPSWHEQALRENRVKAYEDFEAIAEDLINRKITSAKHLGIEGRSNGGLLVGATMTRRPDLYGAVVCGVPLLDMKRYHKLLAGASWMAEFGDPDSNDWQFIQQYSPYQNLKSGQKYPPTFFFTSTRDDRVHPGHARKMAAKMKAMGQLVDYYENMEGGHKGSSTTEQLAKRIALSFTHLWRQLK